jgi:HEAT repeat protein
MSDKPSPDDIVRGFRAIEAMPETPDRAKKLQRAIAFTKLVKTLEGPGYDKALYDLFSATKDAYLRADLGALLSKRPSMEGFLVERLGSERDPDMQARVLQTLGSMHSKHAAPAARDFLTHKEQRHRDTGLFVLGWVGEKGDVSLLKQHMLNEEVPDLRTTAASALRQMAWHDPKTKEAVLQALKEGFEHEKDEKVLPWIIVMIGMVAVKNLGLREDKENPDVLHGDLEKAKKKTAAFLKTL